MQVVKKEQSKTCKPNKVFEYNYKIDQLHKNAQEIKQLFLIR